MLLQSWQRILLSAELLDAESKSSQPLSLKERNSIRNLSAFLVGICKKTSTSTASSRTLGGPENGGMPSQGTRQAQKQVGNRWQSADQVGRRALLVCLRGRGRFVAGVKGNGGEGAAVEAVDRQSRGGTSANECHQTLLCPGAERTGAARASSATGTGTWVRATRPRPTAAVLGPIRTCPSAGSASPRLSCSI